jgi:diacylglycerol kinase
VLKKGDYLDFIKKVWQLTTLRISPEVLPYHRIYLLIGIGLNFVLSYLVTLLIPVTEVKLELSPLIAMAMKAVNLFFLGFFLYLILRLFKKSDRFFKLFLAIIWGTLLIELVNLAISMTPAFAQYVFDVKLATNIGFAVLFNLIVYASIAWMIVFMGHIFRFGLDVSRFKGIWIGIGYILISGMFSIIIFGNPFEGLV